VTMFLLAAVLLSPLLGWEGVLWANAASHAIGTGMLIYEISTMQRRRPVFDTPAAETAPTLQA
jgi:hypothetical protein